MRKVHWHSGDMTALTKGRGASFLCGSRVKGCPFCSFIPSLLITSSGLIRGGTGRHAPGYSLLRFHPKPLVQWTLDLDLYSHSFPVSLFVFSVHLAWAQLGRGGGQGIGLVADARRCRSLHLQPQPNSNRCFTILPIYWFPLLHLRCRICRMLLQTLFMIVCGLTAVTAQRVLALPDPKSCAKRELLFHLS